MPALDINLGEFSKAGVDRLRFTISKDGVAWAGIDSVVLTFEKPDRETRFERDAVVENDTDGVWYYDTTVDDLDESGWWTLGVVVTDGGVVKRYPGEVGFFVTSEP